MKPGIYHGMSFDEYAAIDAINASAIKAGLESMHEMKRCIDKKSDEPTAAMKFGTDAHCAILEPDRFAAEYKIGKKCGATKADGEPCTNPGNCIRDDGEWFCGVHKKGNCVAPEKFVTAGEYEIITGLIDSLRASSLLPHLQQDTHTEVVVVSEFEGFPIKCRLDALSGDMRLISDLKTIKKCDPRNCRNAIGERGHHVSIFLYAHAIQSHTGVLPDFLMVFGEKSPTASTLGFMADEDDFQIGRNDCVEVLDKWRSAQRSGEYPRRKMSVQTGCLPGWYKDQANAINHNEMVTFNG